jgi:hypothetical protein
MVRRHARKGNRAQTSANIRRAPRYGSAIHCRSATAHAGIDQSAGRHLAARSEMQDDFSANQTYNDSKWRRANEPARPWFWPVPPHS